MVIELLGVGLDTEDVYGAVTRRVPQFWRVSGQSLNQTKAFQLVLKKETVHYFYVTQR